MRSWSASPRRSGPANRSPTWSGTRSLTHVRLEDGYDHTQVDDFLAAVVDLDPHADARPEVARGGLIGKLFG